MRRKRFGLQIRKFQPLATVTEVSEVVKLVNESVLWCGLELVVVGVVRECGVLAVGV